MTFGAGGTPLPTMAAHWPTPCAQDDQKSPEAHMAMKARMKGGPRATITSLTVLAKAWPTPVAADSGEKVTMTTHQGACLLREAVNWSTPAVADVTGGRKARSGQRSTELLLNGQAASLSSRQDLATIAPGPKSSASGLKLNPLFVEWLMGWPIGWTAFACSETELSRFKRRMRSALSQLVSHDAPPAQLSLWSA